MQRVDPILTYTNRYNQQKSSIKFTINDISAPTEVTFHDEVADSFQQQLNQTDEHPIIVIISSCKSTFIQGEPKLTNRSATRFFINHDHEAVEELRNAVRLANWRFD
ncbi:hypothetical protein DCAR_0518935 [Daucus carota subsp. sativus]|uniref:Uncharacterized protein n=1 Tax=Daucus carota subsp. sativus TaxID=79200 RepID=A0AAF0X119_DAUCS|nr:PREDICTED: uncharacterized protein LOC108222449 isoform X2 [Daucus carota subsp. sativus]WOG99582.1 hypothetical protein DCAR_0518935 [Daucus carota subsp. sativus]